MNLRVPVIVAIVAASVLAGGLEAAAFTTRDMLGRDVTLAAPPCDTGPWKVPLVPQRPRS